MFDPNQSNTTKIGIISTTLHGDGEGNLTFGNCFESGTVKLYVGDELKDTAEANASNKTIKFKYHDGDILKFNVEGGVLQISNFEIVQCSCKFSFNFYSLYLNVFILKMKLFQFLKI